MSSDPSSSQANPASASVTEEVSSSSSIASWGDWRDHQWDTLQRLCQIESNSSPSTTLLDTVTSDLVRLSDLIHDATAMRDRLKQLKEWEQSVKRTASTSLADPMASHPLASTNDVSPITPPSSSPEPRTRASSNVSPPPSNRSGSSTSKSQGRSKHKPHHHHQKRTQHHGANATPSGEATPTPASSSATGAAGAAGQDASGSSSSQAQADEQRRHEANEKEQRKRRRMARRIELQAQAAYAEMERRRKESVAANLMDARAKARSSAGSGSGSAHRSRASAYTRSEAESTTGSSSTSNRTSPVMEGGNPFFTSFAAMDRSVENEAYQKVWNWYGAQWKKIAKSSRPAPNEELYTFETFPWPTLNRPTDLADLDHVSIGNFIHHASAASHMGTTDPKETKVAFREAIRAWHSDRDNRWIAYVEENDRERVRKGAGQVSRILNDLAK